MTKILGIDPGYRNIGFAVLEDNEKNPKPILRDRGTIETSPKDPLGKNLQEIEADFSELLDELQPDIVAIEMPFFDRNIPTASSVQRAIGVMHFCVYDWMEEEPVFFHPNTIKAQCGYSNCGKAEIREFVEEYFEIEEPSDHVCDAIVTALVASLDKTSKIR